MLEKSTNKAPYEGNGKVVGLMLFLLNYLEDHSTKKIEIIQQIFIKKVIFALEEI